MAGASPQRLYLNLYYFCAEDKLDLELGQLIFLVSDVYRDLQKCFYFRDKWIVQKCPTQLLHMYKLEGKRSAWIGWSHRTSCRLSEGGAGTVSLGKCVARSGVFLCALEQSWVL